LTKLQQEVEEAEVCKATAINRSIQEAEEEALLPIRSTDLMEPYLAVAPRKRLAALASQVRVAGAIVLLARNTRAEHLQPALLTLLAQEVEEAGMEVRVAAM